MFSTNNLEQLMQTAMISLEENSWVELQITELFWSNLLQRFNEIENTHLLKQASVTQSHPEATPIRNDYTYWLNEETQNDIEKMFFIHIKALQEVLKNYFRISLTNFEVHFAKYPPQHYYKKHIDQTLINNRRFFSFVIYLNPQWDEAFGGQLVAYDKKNQDDILFNILPVAGKMILFKSDIPHEVFPSTQDRRSLTGWIRT